MKNKLITIAGYSCSGKSTVIKQLEEIYNCEIIKFGMVHRECTNRNGYAYAKDWIRDKGFEEYERELAKCYIEKLKAISSNDKITIIDGIFSYKCFLIMKECESIDLTNIVLNTDYDIRLQRMMQREGLEFNEAEAHLATADSIKRRAGLSRIIDEPSYIVNGNERVEKIKDECLLIISHMSEKEKNIKKETNFPQFNNSDSIEL